MTEKVVNININAEKFAEWVIKHERSIERYARAGHYTLSPVAMYLTSRLGDGRIVARYHREINAFSFGGALHPAPDWVRNFEGLLVWRAGGEDKPVSVDQVLEALADALWLECVKATVRQRRQRS
jgi:hypothetical protein